MSGPGEELLAVQLLDLELDRLERLIQSPPELAVHDLARTELTAAEARRRELADAIADTEATIENSERESTEMAAQRRRLEGQLRNVVVVREAEALQHEIDRLLARADELDDIGLSALDTLETLNAESTRADGDLEALRATEARTGAELAAARAASTEERAAVADRRGEAAGMVDAGTLTRYERLRDRNGGVGIARLEGSRCGGCHLDLSRSEVEELRAAPADELVECPSCGRLLVR